MGLLDIAFEPSLAHMGFRTLGVIVNDATTTVTAVVRTDIFEDLLLVALLEGLASNSVPLHFEQRIIIRLPRTH